MENNRKNELLQIPQDQSEKQDTKQEQLDNQLPENNFQNLELPPNKEQFKEEEEEETHSQPKDISQKEASLQNEKKPSCSETKQQYSQKLRRDRIFVIDTNVLLHDPNAIFSFQSVVVGIPFIVLEELDTFKKESGEKGRNAREVIRNLDELRSRGCLGTGVDLNHNTGGAILKVLSTPQLEDILTDNPQSIKDNYILQTVQNLKKENFKVTLVTKDINARVKADVLGLEAEDYTKGKVSFTEFYKGWTNVAMPAIDVKNMTTKRIGSALSHVELKPNQFIVTESDNNPQNYRLFRYLGGAIFKEVMPITLMNSFTAKNLQQLMALDLLMDDRIQLLTLIGPAGTGKTFLTLLAGLYKVAYERVYRKFLVTRPVIALGADIGYLPGDVQEKLHYWMQPIHDNLEFIFSQMMRGSEEHFNLGGRKDHKKKEKAKEDNKQQNRRPQMPHETHSIERLQQKGILSLEAITYMRGRSIPYQFVFIDEVQNLTPHEVKTIVSRAGEGTKVILAGDPYQIDSPYLDFTSNGLTVTTEKFKDQSIFGTIFLETSERSKLAKLAAEIL